MHHETRQRYTHKPLDLDTDQFRLLKVARQPSGPIACALEIHARHEAPTYTALSYTWGDPHDTKDIRIDGLPLKVTSNLYSYLDNYARPHKPRLGAETDVDYLWIDQICIDQSSLIERNHQVQHMASIFKKAICVDAWLGKEEKGSAQAIEHITKVIREFADLPEWLDFRRDARKDQCLSQENITRIRAYQTRYARELKLLIRLLERPYWTRLWILQEFALARNLRIVCGMDMFSWQSFDAFVNICSWFDLIKALDFDWHVCLHWWTREYMIQRDAGAFNFNIVCACSVLHCSEPRDRIYGLLGLCNDEELRIQVDYSKTTQDVFWEAMAVFKSSKIEGSDPLLWLTDFYQLGESLGVQREDLERYDMVREHYVTNGQAAAHIPSLEGEDQEQ